MAVQHLIVSALRRFGLWPVNLAMTACAVLASVTLTFGLSQLLKIHLSLAEWLIPVACPAIIAPALVGLVLRLVQRLDQTEEQLRTLNNTDPLTGVYNRRFFMERLQAEARRCMLAGMPCAVAVMDVDDFKRINDTRGHLGGDAALKYLAGLCAAGVRQGDVFARIGGEEFALLLPNTSRDSALALLERLRDKIAAGHATYDDRAIQFTVSVGVAVGIGFWEADGLLSRADQALYAAKRAGKNRVCSGDTLLSAASARPRTPEAAFAPPDGEFFARSCHSR